MKKLLLGLALLVTMSSFAESNEAGKSPLRDSVEGTVVAGGGAFVFMSAGLGGSGMIVPIAMVGSSGVMGYGVGKIIRSIDAVTGKNLQNLMYWIGDKSGVFKIIYENTNPSSEEITEILDEVDHLS